MFTTILHAAQHPDAKDGGVGCLSTQCPLPASDLGRWPDLDIDLSVESIRNPECFPLKAQ